MHHVDPACRRRVGEDRGRGHPCPAARDRPARPRRHPHRLRPRHPRLAGGGVRRAGDPAAGRRPAAHAARPAAVPLAPAARRRGPSRRRCWPPTAGSTAKPASASACRSTASTRCCATWPATGVTLAVATSKAQVYAEKIVEYRGWTELFATVCGDTLDAARPDEGRRRRRGACAASAVRPTRSWSATGCTTSRAPARTGSTASAWAGATRRPASWRRRARVAVYPDPAALGAALRRAAQRDERHVRRLGLDEWPVRRQPDRSERRRGRARCPAARVSRSRPRRPARTAPAPSRCPSRPARRRTRSPGWSGSAPTTGHAVGDERPQPRPARHDRAQPQSRDLLDPLQGERHVEVVRDGRPRARPGSRRPARPAGAGPSALKYQRSAASHAIGSGPPSGGRSRAGSGTRATAIVRRSGVSPSGGTPASAATAVRPRPRRVDDLAGEQRRRRPRARSASPRRRGRSATDPGRRPDRAAAGAQPAHIGVVQGGDVDVGGRLGERRGADSRSAGQRRRASSGSTGTGASGSPARSASCAASAASRRRRRTPSTAPAGERGAAAPRARRPGPRTAGPRP